MQRKRITLALLATLSLAPLVWSGSIERVDLRVEGMT